MEKLCSWRGIAGLLGTVAAGLIFGFFVPIGDPPEADPENGYDVGNALVEDAAPVDPNAGWPYYDVSPTSLVQP